MYCFHNITHILGVSLNFYVHRQSLPNISNPLFLFSLVCGTHSISHGGCVAAVHTVDYLQSSCVLSAQLEWLL